MTAVGTGKKKVVNEARRHASTGQKVNSSVPTVISIRHFV